MVWCFLAQSLFRGSVDNGARRPERENVTRTSSAQIWLGSHGRMDAGNGGEERRRDGAIMLQQRCQWSAEKAGVTEVARRHQCVLFTVPRVSQVSCARVSRSRKATSSSSTKESPTLCSTSRIRKQRSTCCLDSGICFAWRLLRTPHLTCNAFAPAQSAWMNLKVPRAQNGSPPSYLKKNIAERDGIRGRLRMSHPGSGNNRCRMVGLLRRLDGQLRSTHGPRSAGDSTGRPGSADAPSSLFPKWEAEEHFLWEMEAEAEEKEYTWRVRHGRRRPRRRRRCTGSRRRS